VACIDPVSEDITCYWITQNSAQSQFSLKGQRFEGTSRAWGTTGITFLPLGSTQTTAAGCHPRDDGGTTVIWNSGFIPQPTSIYAAAVDADGGPVWTSDAGGVTGGVTISNVASNKSRTTTATSPSGEIVIAWSDERDGSSRRIYGQNLRVDGELGDAALVGDLNGDGVVNAADLGLLIVAWGPCGKGVPCPADLNEDGIVDAADLGFLFANWS
ncbi:MAG: dockerin type I domain-containing protein, partial [Planctomycetota bacterium]